MMRAPKILPLLLITLILTLGLATTAPPRATANGDTTVTIAVTAKITHITDPENLLADTISEGDTISGVYVYDTTTPDTHPLPEYGNYQHTTAPSGFFLGAGSLSFQTDPSNVNFLVYLADNAGGYDRYIAISYTNLPLPTGSGIDYIVWHLVDPAEAALTSTTLPTTAPILADWSFNVLEIDGHDPTQSNSFQIVAEVTQVGALSLVSLFIPLVLSDPGAGPGEGFSQ